MLVDHDTRVGDRAKSTPRWSGGWQAPTAERELSNCGTRSPRWTRGRDPEGSLLLAVDNYATFVGIVVGAIVVLFAVVYVAIWLTS